MPALMFLEALGHRDASTEGSPGACTVSSHNPRPSSVWGTRNLKHGEGGGLPRATELGGSAVCWALRGDRDTHSPVLWEKPQAQAETHLRAPTTTTVSRESHPQTPPREPMARAAGLAHRGHTGKPVS